ncbi:hypothetical protein BHM03_00010243 [Ensete ventricosum]|uniref:Uncharacterized protein n=1 Tax=Ensete ventricosum TaxID=4639 RepID=A0A445MCZ4_ENSVE|nr:hypothetical protein BHM03_00010243 [Ensete ventricosum]
MSSSSPSGSDDGDAFDADMEALRRACALTGADPADVGGAYLDSDSDSGSDDAGLLRRLQERFYSPSQAVDSFSLVKPLSYIAPMDLDDDDDDDDDDFETLRAIQLRFTQYNSGNSDTVDWGCFRSVTTQNRPVTVDFDRRGPLSGDNGQFRSLAADFGWYQSREKEEEGEEEEERGVSATLPIPSPA